MALAALISVYGYLAGAMVNVPRLSYAMAVEGDLPPALGRVHPRFHTPHVSVIVYATLVWLLAASGSFLQNLTLSAVSRLFTYGVVCAALIACRRREELPDAPPVPPAKFRLPAGKVWAVLGIAGTALLATRMARQELLVLAGTAILATLNWAWATRRSR
jgi:amino acid transporter